jgi:hypothetical protein
MHMLSDFPMLLFKTLLPLFKPVYKHFLLLDLQHVLLVQLTQLVILNPNHFPFVLQIGYLLLMSNHLLPELMILFSHLLQLVCAVTPFLVLITDLLFTLLQIQLVLLCFESQRFVVIDHSLVQ